jgi:uncharacterized protein (DUF1800 family)
MNTKDQLNTQHLYLRASFGTNLSEIDSLHKKSPTKIVSKLLENSKKVENLTVIQDNLLSFSELAEMTKEEKKDLRKESKDLIKQLNIKWLDKMTYDLGMREKMTFFWHGHFACQSPNVFFVQNQNNILRTHALGKFGDLLMAISKDAAMLQFLNNQQNKKNSPNENFAREVMELFTLGRGNYTETDIKQAAKAFTGWSSDETGKYVFRQRMHDFGTKTFMNKTGNFSGEDILKMLLENKQTAYFITLKIYRYFVNPNLDEKGEDLQKITELSDKFYQSEYDISQLMESIFTADWFYDDKHKAARIKSPVELIVGLRRQLQITFNEVDTQLVIQKVLGQVLFFPPNVAGWKEGKSWIDSSTILFRTLLPFVLFRGNEMVAQAKNDGDVNTDFLAKRNKDLQATFNTKSFIELLGKEKQEEIIETLTNFMLQIPISDTNRTLIKQNLHTETTEKLISSLLINLATLPEYQLC